MSEFNLKKYISNNPLLTEGKEEKVDKVVNEELDLVHVYDKNGKKIIGTGRVVQSEKPNPFDVIVQFDRDLVLTFPRDRVKPVKEEVNEDDSKSVLRTLIQDLEPFEYEVYASTIVTGKR